MKRILLVSNHVFHYRQKVYNYFYDAFLNDGYEFHVLSDSFQDAGYEYRFIRHDGKLNMKNCRDIIIRVQPEIVIIFLHLKDMVQIPLIHWCKLKKIKVIFWNKGLSDIDTDSAIKKILYHHIHNQSDALITYTPDMVVNFQEKNRSKLFVAYNTVDCSDIDKSKYDRADIKLKYGIKEKYVVLYISRIRPAKKPEALINALAYMPDIAVIMMGAGMNDELQRKIDEIPNIYYVGQKYGDEGNEIWAIGDVFSIPVNCGLGINEAIFWGMPIVTMQGFQPPEIYYLKEGKTGYIAANEAEYKMQLLSLLHNNDELERMKSECIKEYHAETSIQNMYHGFIDAIRYCESEEIRQKT